MSDLSKEYLILKGFKHNNLGAEFGGLTHPKCVGMLVNADEHDFAISFGNWDDGIMVDLKSITHFEQIVKLIFDLDL